MKAWLLPIILLALAASGCSSVENAMGRKFTVKDYTAASGERVLAAERSGRTSALRTPKDPSRGRS